MRCIAVLLDSSPNGRKTLSCGPRDFQHGLLKANTPVGEGGFWNASNTISQRIMGQGGSVATAKIDVSGMAPGQQAGFSHHSGRYVLIGLKADEDGVRRLMFNDNGVERIGPTFTATGRRFPTARTASLGCASGMISSASSGAGTGTGLGSIPGTTSAMRDGSTLIGSGICTTGRRAGYLVRSRGDEKKLDAGLRTIDGGGLRDATAGGDAD